MLRRLHDCHKESFVTETPHSPKGIGTVTLTLTGIAAAFGVAACCALPILLASAGIGATWLGGVAFVAAPYRTPLLLIGALCLVTGAALLLRQQVVAARCGPNGVCTPRWMRLLTLVGLLLGVALLWAGDRYV